METNKLIAGIVAAAIAIIVLAGVLMPALSNATDTEDTFTNDGYFRMNKIESTDTETYTIQWDSDSAGELVINGVTVPVVNTTGGGWLQYSIFASETDMIRLGTSDNTGTTLSWVQIRGSQIAFAQTSTSFDATISAGTLSATFSGNDTKTSTYSTAYIIDETNTGSYVMKKSNESAYMNSDSIIYSVGFTHPAIYQVSGTIEDITVTNLYSGADVITISDEEVHYSAVDNYIDLYKFDNVTFTASIEGGTTSQVTYSYVIVPYEVTAEKAVHLTPAMNVILNVIPLLIIVAVLLGVVAVFILRRE